MSLLDEFTDKFVMMDKISVPDGYGGFDIVYQEGAEFEAAMGMNDSIEARIADAKGIKNRYSIYPKQNINLNPYDVIKRLKDDKIFRITSDGDDKKTPPSSPLNRRKYNAEEWRLPDE